MKARSRLGSRANGLVASRSLAISQHPFANSKPNRLAGLRFSPARRSEDGSLLADPSFAGEARMVSQSLFGWAEPEILVQSHKCSGFPTAENDASCVSVDDRRSVKVVGTVLDC